MRSLPIRLLLCLILSALLLGCAAEDQTPATTVVATVSATFSETDAAPPPWSVAGVELSQYRIIHDDTDCAETYAKQIRLAIQKVTGISLTILPDTVRETEYEILVGKTDRTPSVAMRAAFARPNVTCRIETSGTKLILMGEGYTTLRLVADRFCEMLEAEDCPRDLAVLTYSEDLSAESPADPGNSVMLRADGTDLRILHWNMAAPYLDPAVTTPPVVYDSNKTRGEVMADLLLQMLPDIITTNEFYASHNGNTTLFRAVMGELEEYYFCLESPYDKDHPIAGADAIPGKTINSNILIRRDAGIEVISSAWRYSTEQTKVTASNPHGFVYYHGSHTALLEKDGKRFILSTAHYADGREDNQWAVEQLSAVAEMGGGEKLPIVLTGDLYTSYSSPSGHSAYRYLTANGYLDSQREARYNANRNIDHGTFHKIGTRQTNRISEDFVFYTTPMQALCFKVLASKLTDDTSDHYPVIADLAFD